MTCLNHGGGVILVYTIGRYCLGVGLGFFSGSVFTKYKFC